METFKKISIGGLSKEALLQRLTEAGVQFNEYAKVLFTHPAFAPSEDLKEITLVKAGLSDLGLNMPFSYEAALARASARGLKTCPLYLAAFLRLQYLDQPAGPYLTVASEPLAVEFPNGFYIRHTKGALWLRGYRAEGETEWPEGNEFIFWK